MFKERGIQANIFKCTITPGMNSHEPVWEKLQVKLQPAKK